MSVTNKKTMLGMLLAFWIAGAASATDINSISSFVKVYTVDNMPVTLQLTWEARIYVDQTDALLDRNNAFQSTPIRTNTGCSWRIRGEIQRRVSSTPEGVLPQTEKMISVFQIPYDASGELVKKGFAMLPCLEAESVIAQDVATYKARLSDSLNHIRVDDFYSLLQMLELSGVTALARSEKSTVADLPKEFGFDKRFHYGERFGPNMRP